MNTKNKAYFINYMNSFDLLNKFICNSTVSIPKIKKAVCNLNTHKVQNYTSSLSEEEYASFLLKVWVFLNLLSNGQSVSISSFQYREFKKNLKVERKRKEEINILNLYNLSTRINILDDWFILTIPKIQKVLNSVKKFVDSSTLTNKKTSNNLRITLSISDIAIKQNIIKELFTIEEMLHLEIQVNILFQNNKSNYLKFKEYKNIFPLWSIQNQ